MKEYDSFTKEGKDWLYRVLPEVNPIVYLTTIYLLILSDCEIEDQFTYCTRNNEKYEEKHL